ncbi:EAL domain-containing protein [Thermomonas brevis]|uniref:cyclic-guanylate-specific phosphodiesterase n=1 Tax=Thermomonas brevis TaxID=215691 RepID=A0A7G9QT86_9GAMM|nr:EAL domain-containing protein [Thermomonas brevis]QNN46561.1 EAL domain-containing protein [Thermomonas brevis]
MPAILRKLSSSFLPVSALLAVVLPTAIALLMAHWVGMQRLEEIATMTARQTLARADTINIEMTRANGMLAPLDGQDPCGRESIRLMRKAMLHTDTLTDVGYIRGDRVLCSAFGQQDQPVGAPAYTSGPGFAIRNDVRLSDAPDIPLVATTVPQTGVSMFAHGAQVMDGIPADEPWRVAVVGYGQGPGKAVVLARRGEFDPGWLERATAADAGTFLHAQQIVAWERSKIGAYTAFAAMPPEVWRPALRKSTRLALALGLPASLLLAFAFRRMASRNTTIRNLLRQAIKRDELSLAYQPIVELDTGRWIGAEALMRWNRPRGETISPDIFIPIAEKSGLMPALREHLIHMVERETPALFARHPDFHVALNFCAEDFCAAGFTTRLAAAIERIGARPGNLQVEVTERVFMHLEDAAPAIGGLQKLGVSVAIDDFGTGFSSLSYLTRLQFDCLKIDKTFVGTVDTGAVTSKIVDHIIEMSKSLGIAMIAEGVETQAQADYLRERGVRYAQGWLYAKAMPIRELLERLHAAHSAA